jgi:NAD(P)-dependent dehydrogenase (short-subunit alcohol dehydrogenase family)
MAKSIGDNVKSILGDVSDLASLDLLFGEIRQLKGRLDILMANAAAGEHSPAWPLLILADPYMMFSCSYKDTICHFQSIA